MSLGRWTWRRGHWYTNRLLLSFSLPVLSQQYRRLVRPAKYRGLDEHAYFDQGGTTPFVRA